MKKRLSQSILSLGVFSYRLNDLKWIAYILCLFSLILPSCSSSKNFQAVSLSDQTIHLMDSVCMENLHQEHYPGLAIAVARDGKIIWQKGFGYADLELKKAVDPAEHLFRIGSVSKTVTASALARLTEKGFVKLDTPIEEYYKECPADKKNITLRQLGGHQSGIRHYLDAEFFSNIHYPHVEEALDVFVNDKLLFPPGTKYSYSTYGWSFLSAVMEDAVDKPFLQVIHEEVRQPLKISDLKADQIDSIHFNRVQFYEFKDGNHSISPAVDNSNKWAGGGFLCSAEDLARFGIALSSAGFLQQKTLLEFTTPQSLANGEKTNYGIGFSTGTDKDSISWYGHSGGSVGGTSMLLIYPQEKIVVVTLVNLSSANMKGLAWTIAEMVRKSAKQK